MKTYFRNCNLWEPWTKSKLRKTNSYWCFWKLSKRRRV